MPGQSGTAGYLGKVTDLGVGTDKSCGFDVGGVGNPAAAVDVLVLFFRFLVRGLIALTEVEVGARGG